MGRKILLVTTDQQRYDTLGCNGGTLAPTPVVDGLAAEGIRFERAHPQSVVCMPSRSTILTGQHPSTHGVWMNGVPLPVDAPSVADLLHRAGYRTALVGKAHFEPFLDPFFRFPENALASSGTLPPGALHRGFEHLELATHGAVGPLHYARWMMAEHPEAVGGFYPALDGSLQVNAAGGGDTGAPQVKVNPIDRGIYHTDWVADRTIGWLDTLGADEDWFCWMSFPDPHHPWDPPESEVGRIDWREVPLPGGLSRGPVPTGGDPRRQAPALAPLVRRHPGVELRGAGRLGTGHPHRRPGPRGQRPQRGGVRADRRGPRPGAGPDRRTGLGRRPRRGVHHRPRGAPGRFRPAVQGSVPRRRADAPSPGVATGSLGRHATVGGQPARGTGRPGPDLLRHRRDRTRRTGWRGSRSRSTTTMPRTRGFERVLTEWDSELFGTDVHLRTIMRDHWVCSTYLPGTVARRDRGGALRPRRRPAPTGQPVGRPGVPAAPRRPGGRPVGPPARGPPTPAGPRGTGLSASRRGTG